MRRERIASNFVVIRAIVLEDSPRGGGSRTGQASSVKSSKSESMALLKLSKFCGAFAHKGSPTAPAGSTNENPVCPPELKLRTLAHAKQLGVAC